MTQRNTPRGGLRLDHVATVLTIIVCVLASLWLGRDLAYGGWQPRVTAATRSAAAARTPVRPTSAPLPKEPVSIKGAALKGSADARIALVIYSDFECPFCARFANEAWPAIDSKYVGTGKLRAAFRHLPIESIHPSAVKAAEATECAGQQGQFWPMHDILFKNSKQLGAGFLSGYARQIELNLPTFEACLKGTMTAKVRADAKEAADLGITVTPAFFLGTIEADGRVRVVERIAGARPLVAFETAIDKVLASSMGTK